MTAPTSDDRPRLVALVLGEDLPEVAGWLALLRELLATAKAPGSVRQPRASAKLGRYVLVLTAAARDVQAAEHRAAAERALAPRPIGAIAHPASQSEPQGTITVVEAADLLGCTRQHVRRLAATRRITGYRSERAVWHLDPASVIAYRDRARGRSDGDNGQTGPGRQARPSAA